MKSFLLFCSFIILIISVQLQAQVVITKSNFEFKSGTYPNNATLQKDYFSQLTGPNLIIAPPALSSFGGVSTVTFFDSEFPQPSNSLFTNSFENLNSNAGFNIQNIFVVDDLGFKQTSVMTEEQHYDLSAQTGNPNDSLVIPSQLAFTTGERMILKFSATSESVWTSNFSWTVTGNITVNSVGLKNTPITKFATIKQQDSIIGWGKAQIPTGGGRLSAFYDVLIEQRTLVQVDSFFLNGQPVSQLIGGALGLKQGSTTVELFRKFWRTSFINLVSINYGKDTTFTTPLSIRFDGTIPPITSVDEDFTASNSIAYPNPTSNNVTISYNQTSNTMTTIEFFNLIGTNVKSVPVYSPAETVHVPISLSEFANGLYRYSVRNQHGRILSQGSVTVVK